MDRHRGMSGIGASWTSRGRSRPTVRSKLGLSIVSISNGNEDAPKRGNSDMAQILSRVSSRPVPPPSQVAGCDYRPLKVCPDVQIPFFDCRTSEGQKAR